MGVFRNAAAIVPDDGGQPSLQHVDRHRQLTGAGVPCRVGQGLAQHGEQVLGKLVLARPAGVP
jgi:hypothetical protein